MVERISSREFEKPREECGVFGIYTTSSEFKKNIVNLTLTGLHENQHRGEESAGFVVVNENGLSKPFKRMGLVKDLHKYFYESERNFDERFYGQIAIGHNRYSTTGSSNLENAAPFVARGDLGEIAVAHNGNITNANELKDKLATRETGLESTTDSEILTRLIAEASGDSWITKMQNTLSKVKGSYSLVMCTEDGLYAARDALGNRPLSFGASTNNGDMIFAISSESQGLESLGMTSISDVLPGEIIKFGPGKQIETYSFEKCESTAFCGLEIAYLMRPDSRINNIQLNQIRNSLGQKLAQRFPPMDHIDFVTYVPESAKASAEGYVEELNKTKKTILKTTMLKNRYGALEGAMRGFINPNKEVRGVVANKSYHTFDDLNGANIVLIDDSIIRGKTTEGVIKTLKEKGVGDIHLRIIFPPVIGYCPLGIDINENDYLIAKELRDKKLIAEKLGITSLEYLSVEDYEGTVNEALKTDFKLCLGCVTENYPIGKFNACKTILEKK